MRRAVNDYQERDNGFSFAGIVAKCFDGVILCDGPTWIWGGGNAERDARGSLGTKEQHYFLSWLTHLSLSKKVIIVPPLHYLYHELDQAHERRAMAEFRLPHFVISSKTPDNVGKHAISKLSPKTNDRAAELGLPEPKDAGIVMKSLVRRGYTWRLGYDKRQEGWVLLERNKVFPKREACTVEVYSDQNDNEQLSAIVRRGGEKRANLIYRTKVCRYNALHKGTKMTLHKKFDGTQTDKYKEDKFAPAVCKEIFNEMVRQNNGAVYPNLREMVFRMELFRNREDGKRLLLNRIGVLPFEQTWICSLDEDTDMKFAAEIAIAISNYITKSWCDV